MEKMGKSPRKRNKVATYNNNGVVDEILTRCNIIDVIGSVVTLKKTGANYTGLCPFHNEKTPSFVVSESKQIFTCFGCHTSGNVIKFVMLYYNLSFPEALEKLANEYGIEYKKNTYGNKQRDLFYEINTQAARFFFRALRKGNNPGLNYVLNRKLSQKTLHDFGIGYADKEWDSLYRHLKSLGFNEDLMVKSGLISNSKGKYYDKFRDRVIFPIQNTAGKVIGFGGRAIGDQMPKYLNSPETAVFSKKNNLYGLNITKNFVNQEDRIILVEGYMDVVSLYQAGVTNVAASLGTALTENQAKLIKRFTKNVALSYDSDSAGINASVRGSEILYKEGLKVRILHVTDGKDPDEFVKEHGKLAYKKLVDEALLYGDYMIKNISSQYDLSSTEGRVDFLRNVAKFLQKLSPVEADVYIEKITANYHISEGALRNEMNAGKEQWERVQNIENERSKDAEKKVAKANDITKIEQNLVKILLTDARYFKDVCENRDVFKSVVGTNIFSAMEKVYMEYEDIDYGHLLEYLEEDEIKVLTNINENISLGGKIEQVFKDCLESYREEWLAEQEKEIITLIDIADEQNNSSEVEKLTEELMKIQKAKILGGNR